MSELTELKWTEAERQWPRVRIIPDADGQNECPECHGRGTFTDHPTHSPSDARELPCETCKGAEVVLIIDDRYDVAGW